MAHFLRQGNLVWNVSPLMASMEPPTLYAGSFWSRPYKVSYKVNTLTVPAYPQTIEHFHRNIVGFLCMRVNNNQDDMGLAEAM